VVTSANDLESVFQFFDVVAVIDLTNDYGMILEAAKHAEMWGIVHVVISSDKMPKNSSWSLRG
jgi:hypothetical protein